MKQKESNVQSRMNKDVLGQKPPVDGPLKHEHSTQIKCSLLKELKRVFLVSVFYN